MKQGKQQGNAITRALFSVLFQDRLMRGILEGRFSRCSSRVWRGSVSMVKIMKLPWTGSMEYSCGRARGGRGIQISFS